jgi:hypothetical protein
VRWRHQHARAATVPILDEALVRIPTRRLSRLYLESPSGQGITLTSHVPAALMVRRVDDDHDTSVLSSPPTEKSARGSVVSVNIPCSWRAANALRRARAAMRFATQGRSSQRCALA